MAKQPKAPAVQGTTTAPKGPTYAAIAAANNGMPLPPKRGVGPWAGANVGYVMGPKPYTPRASAFANNATWELVQAALAAGGGTCTGAALAAAVMQRNHAGFVPYALRHGWLAIAPTA